jgi:hypothetical protein
VRVLAVAAAVIADAIPEALYNMFMTITDLINYYMYEMYEL